MCKNSMKNKAFTAFSILLKIILIFIIVPVITCTIPDMNNKDNDENKETDQDDPINPSESSLNIKNTGYSNISKIFIGKYDEVNPVIYKELSSLLINNTISLNDIPVNSLFNVWFDITSGSDTVTLVIKDDDSELVDFIINNGIYYLILDGGNPEVNYDYYILNDDDSKKCAPVIFYLSAGAYTETQTLVLRCPTPNTNILYRLNDNSYSSTYYTPYSVTKTVNITAYSEDSRFTLNPYQKSDEKIRYYQILIPPVINAFDFSNNQIVNIPTVQIAYPYIDASDNDTVAEYMITESNNIPSADDSRWQSNNPKEYTFTANEEGDYTLYAWTKDNEDLISEPFPQTVHLEYGFLSNQIKIENGEVSFIDTSDIGDINNDGRNDIVFFGKGGAVGAALYYRQLDNNGNFGDLITLLEKSDEYKSCGKVILDDFNNDGYLDIIAFYFQNVLCFLNNQNGTFAEPIVILASTGYTDMAIGDINNDSRNDIILSGYSDGMVHLFYKNTDGTINSTAHSYYAGQSYVNELTLGDISGDGKTDIIVTNTMDSKSSGNFHVLYQTDSGFTAVQNCGVGLNVTTSAVSIADVDNDGLNDVVVSSGWNTGDSKINVFTQSAGVIPTLPSYSFDSLGGPADCIIYDINNDGLNDIIIYSDYSYSLGVYLQSSTEIFTFERQYSHKNNCELLFLSDVNLDGRPDIISTGFSGSIILHYNQSHLTNE